MVAVCGQVLEFLAEAGGLENKGEWFVAYLSDRHLDAEIRVFRRRDDALSAAWQFMEEHMAHTSLIKEHKVLGHELFLRYGDEEDHAFVIRVALE
jgi:hypothetical protein